MPTRSCEGTPPGTEIGMGEELAGPAMDVETAACSAARATFTALTTAAKKAGSGATEAETEEPATGVDTGGARRRRINVRRFRIQRRVTKEAGRHAIVGLAWSSHYRRRKALQNDGKQTAKQ